LSSSQLRECTPHSRLTKVPLSLPRRHHIGGAQPPEAFLEVFDKLLVQAAASPAGSSE
jgi:hypothetical protein